MTQNTRTELLSTSWQETTGNVDAIVSVQKLKLHILMSNNDILKVSRYSKYEIDLLIYQVLSL